MSLEILAGLLGSQLVRAVASEMATTLACQAIQHAVGTMARPTSCTDIGQGTSTQASPDLRATPAPRGTTSATSLRELRALPTVEVVSSVPGRARLRVQGLRDDADRAAELMASVQVLDGVISAEARPLTGTLLVRFDAKQTDVARIVAALEPPLPARPLRAADRAPYLRLVVG
jgi:hypothetical protein